MNHQVITDSLLDDQMISTIHSAFMNSTFRDTVNSQYYNVMLSLPADWGPNSFKCLGPDGTEILKRQLNNSAMLHPYVAYSPAGSIKVMLCNIHSSDIDHYLDRIIDIFQKSSLHRKAQNDTKLSCKSSNL